MSVSCAEEAFAKMNRIPLRKNGETITDQKKTGHTFFSRKKS